ncbi:YbjQ family protein [Rariglobus hedericola]|uniref:YbjQ family protein n=1 Tax=Rariglobus hedericola TaxID=2597822 RepID=A0A556QSM1_9BACT|nr:heavy metal-binding domain-containing protein [Rariglobus hedericola]TSJ79623.1 YbjQ family protein [Rariglobus hedericola]
MNAENPETLVMVLTIAFYVSPFIFMVIMGLIGRSLEKTHFASIRTREAATAKLPVITSKHGDSTLRVVKAEMVTGSVVVSLDHFKRFLARLRMIFGGRVTSYETLLDRARREATLRLKESCAGADIVLNFRMETSTIANTKGKQGAGGVEVLVYGTAITYGGPIATPPPLVPVGS